MSELETWEVWYPYVAATGLHFARGRLDPTEVLLVHAVPDAITAEVRDQTASAPAHTISRAALQTVSSRARSTLCRRPDCEVLKWLSTAIATSANVATSFSRAPAALAA
jgi:hypothetical protein